MLKKAKLFEYRPPKFFNDYVVAGLNNAVYLVNKYQPYAGGAGPISLSNGNELSGMIRMGTADLFEDFKINGGFRLATNLRDNDVLFEFTNLRRRWDWGFTYYRSTSEVNFQVDQSDFWPGKQHSNYYLGRVRYALDRVRSIRATVGPRFDRSIISAVAGNPNTLKAQDSKQVWGQVALEYVHDNTITPTTNIWHGLRYKAYIDWFTFLTGERRDPTLGKLMFNAGVDVRHYLPIYRNIIWAVRGAADFSWGDQKVVYYLGGVDGWLKIPRQRKNRSQYKRNFRLPLF